MDSPRARAFIEAVLNTFDFSENKNFLFFVSSSSSTTADISSLSRSSTSRTTASVSSSILNVGLRSRLGALRRLALFARDFCAFTVSKVFARFRLGWREFIFDKFLESSAISSRSTSVSSMRL